MGGPSPKKDIKELIKSSRLPERSVEVCLHPDLLAEMQDAERRLQDAQRERAANGSLASGSAERTIAEEMEALRQDMLEHTVTFRLRALRRREFTALQAKYPPRPDNTLDAVAGTNLEEVAEVLVRRSVVSPPLDDEDWAGLDESLSDGQFQLLANAAWAINARDVDVPFSRTASRILQTSESESAEL